MVIVFDYILNFAIEKNIKPEVDNLSGNIMKGGKMSQLFSNILLELKKVDGVKMVALAGHDGYLIGEQASEDKELLTLMSATMLKAAEKVTNRLENVSPKRVIVDFDGGKVIAEPAGAKALVLVTVSPDANIEPIISELERTCCRIKDIS